MKGVLTGLIEPSTVGFRGRVGESVVGGVEDVKAIGGIGDAEVFAGSDMWPLVVSSFSVLRPFMTGSCAVISGSVSFCIGLRWTCGHNWHFSPQLKANTAAFILYLVLC